MSRLVLVEDANVHYFRGNNWNAIIQSFLNLTRVISSLQVKNSWYGTQGAKKRVRFSPEMLTGNGGARSTANIRARSCRNRGSAFRHIPQPLLEPGEIVANVPPIEKHVPPARLEQRGAANFVRSAAAWSPATFQSVGPRRHILATACTARPAIERRRGRNRAAAATRD